jgi:hypothetical protein
MPSIPFNWWQGLPFGVGGGSTPPVEPEPEPEPELPGDVDFRFGAFTAPDDSRHLLTYIPNHAELASDLLLWQHKGKRNIEAFVAALAAGAQLQEETTFAVFLGSSTIDGAEGANLDRWGAIVGEARGELGEEAYRRFIDLRIRVNTEFPSRDAMWTVLASAVAPSKLSSSDVADGIIYRVDSEGDWLPSSIAAHAAGLLRDFRPVAIYAPIVEQLVGRTVQIGTVAQPGTLIGTVASPSPELIGKLLYSGRSH